MFRALLEHIAWMIPVECSITRQLDEHTLVRGERTKERLKRCPTLRELGLDDGTETWVAARRKGFVE